MSRTRFTFPRLQGILADRGGQRFRLPQIQENVLPIWFHHSATHDPNVWIQYNVPAML